jgi:hypothetical protein
LVSHSSEIIKYADDTTLYAATNKCASSLLSAIQQVEAWSEESKLQLNIDKTVRINISLTAKPQQQGQCQSGSTIAATAKFLGIIVDCKLTFSDHVGSITSRCNSKIYIMLQLKRMGMDTSGLRKFYCTYIRPSLVYGAPAWYTLLSGQDRAKLENVQRAALRVILPEQTYEERLSSLNMPSIENFIHTISQDHFNKIFSNPDHPLHRNLCFNNNRTSSRKPSTFKVPLCRTQKFKQSFFNVFMDKSNRN